MQQTTTIIYRDVESATGYSGAKVVDGENGTNGWYTIPGGKSVPAGIVVEKTIHIYYDR
jgi:hypothetical protein